MPWNITPRAACAYLLKGEQMFPAAMRRDHLPVRTKLTPPRLHGMVRSRPTLTARLLEALDYRLTIVQAGTGYSKTTALASLQGAGAAPVFWYSVDESDADPQRFLSHIIEAFRIHLPALSDLPLAYLQERGNDGSRAGWEQTVDALVNALCEALTEPAILVIDDYHLAARSQEVNALAERLVSYRPPNLHVIISTRYPLAWPSLVTWRAKGEVLEIGRDILAFSKEEILSLFRDAYHIPLSTEEMSLLIEKTEGWPIALQLVRQGLKGGPFSGIIGLFREGSASLAALFDYLARDVLGAQPREIAEFLNDTAVLRQLSASACDAVRGEIDSAAMIERLLELDLFVVSLGSGLYRYHHLFHDFLRQQSAQHPEATRERHRRAARFFEQTGDFEEAIYHWLAAADPAKAAVAIEQGGEAALRAGWLDTVATWIDALTPEVLADHPLLQAFLGDVYRLRSRFEEAQEWYSQAERIWRARNDPAGVSRALRGQALVYLDTVRPVEANSLLEEALRLTERLPDRLQRARLLELMAENKLNMGNPEEAEQLRVEARSLREEGPGDDTISVRVKLRTGRLDEAQRTLESWAEAERREAQMGQVHPPRAHRETYLMLSLIHSLRGEPGPAYVLAQEGIELAERLDSPFVAAVAHTRLGHACQIQPGPDGAPPLGQLLEEAVRCYNTGISLGDRLSVRRMRAEAMWGLTRAYGFAGDLESARRAAAEGVEIGRWAGDAWIVALIELVLGASYVLAGKPEDAVELLSRVLVSFRECGDSFGRAATRLWLALAYMELGQAELFAASIEDGLSLCEAHGYDFLFTGASFLSPPDPRCLVPALLAARAARRKMSYVNSLLAQLGLPGITVHPGYRLRVYTLGAFRVLRGADEIDPRDWQRDKARQVFQLLLANRGRWMQREEIVERLWPSLPAEAAGRDFKVALNALNRAIEPRRAHAGDTSFSFIVRDGSSYRIRPEADLWLDSAAFEEECLAGLRLLDAEGVPSEEGVAHLQEAIRLYAGDYLPDALYEDWASAERERLLSLFLRSAERLAGGWVETGEYDRALDICARILDRDPCWERAYRWMMLAYARQGNRPLALRAYHRCETALSKELGVEPSPATTALFKSILQAGDLPVTVP